MTNNVSVPIYLRLDRVQAQGFSWREIRGRKSRDKYDCTLIA